MKETVIRIRETLLPFALPDIDNNELDGIKEALDSGWITTGPKVKQFEREFAEFVGVRHAVAVNSATAAMHLSLEAVGLKRGDEVITTPYTFAATAEVVRYFDAVPVFVDIDPCTLNMQPDMLEQAVTERTKAIIPVHIAGLPVDMDPVYRVAQRFGVAVIDDAAHAFPSRYKGLMIGSISDFTCFSFYATKTLTTGEGGMICTNSDSWAERCQIMSLHGISKDAWKRYTAEGSWYYEIVAPGYKYNMTDVAAAMGLAQLAKAERMLERRREISRRYSAAFATIPELQIPPDRSDCQHAWHLYILRLNREQLRIDRAQFIQQLKLRNISSSVHFIPLHLHPYYRDAYGYSPQDFPHSYEEYQRVISLPIYPRMTDSDVQNVIDAVLDIVEEYRG